MQSPAMVPLRNPTEDEAWSDEHSVRAEETALTIEKRL